MKWIVNYFTIDFPIGGTFFVYPIEAHAFSIKLKLVYSVWLVLAQIKMSLFVSGTAYISVSQKHKKKMCVERYELNLNKNEELNKFITVVVCYTLRIYILFLSVLLFVFWLWTWLDRKSGIHLGTVYSILIHNYTCDNIDFRHPCLEGIYILATVRCTRRSRQCCWLIWLCSLIQ